MEVFENWACNSQGCTYRDKVRISASSMWWTQQRLMSADMHDVSISKAAYMTATKVFNLKLDQGACVSPDRLVLASS
jgi:hypothetical protein